MKLSTILAGTANLVVGVAMVGVLWPYASSALTAQATTLYGGAETTEVEVIDLRQYDVASTSTSWFQNRDDKEFFLLNPEKYPEEFCMAQNIYFEAGVDNHAGMSAVADVVLNRVEDRRYPDTVCDVVYDAVMKESWKTKQFPDLPDSERKYIPIRNKCQFSWFCDGKPDDVPLGSENWVRAQMVAWEMMHEGRYRGITEGSTHYHATYVKPYWRTDRGMELIGRIGMHIFYRWN